MIASQKTTHARKIADAWVAAVNAGDVDAVLGLFSNDALIDDPSTGQCFAGQAGIRDYIEQFFLGYHTVTRFLSIDSRGNGRARVRVDFTGDFGHEIGVLDMTYDDDGKIVRIDADLE